MTTDIKPTVRQTRIETGEDYIESLRNRGLCVYLMGERVEEPVDHPIIRHSIKAVAETALLITLEIVPGRLLIKEKNLRNLSRRPSPG